jgi:signal transduction histidine kinase
MTVRDEGIGLADGDADHIFERFERGANAKGRGIAGTGIGLAYVREVIHAHGGQVSVDSQQDAGSTFTVKLPLGPVNISPPPEPDTPAAMRS